MYFMYNLMFNKKQFLIIIIIINLVLKIRRNIWNTCQVGL